MDIMICECGHSKYEHNSPEDWEDEDLNDTFCFYKDCDCKNYRPIRYNDKST